jgi:acyl dehydratase
MRDLLGIDFRYVLHGEQHFTYHRMAFAGDVLRFQQRVADIYAKKGGALEFAVSETTVHNQRGELVAELRGVTVVRHPQK